MRVLFVNAIGFVGGAEKWIVNLTRRLTPRGHAIELAYDPRSPLDLAAVLRRLAEDRSALEALARHIPVVKAMDAHADEWDRIYSDLVSGTARQAS